MTREQALAYLADHHIAAVSQNLSVAISGGKPEQVDALLTAGADLRDLGLLPGTGFALVLANCGRQRVSTEAMIETLLVLVAHGDDINGEPPGGTAPLIFAAGNCPGDVVTAMIRAGAKVDVRTPQGFKPLSLALLSRNYDAAEALIAAGARLSADAARKLTASGGDDERVLTLIRRATAK